MSQRSSLSEGGGVSRRDFLRTTVVGLAAASAASVPFVASVPALGARRRRSRRARAAATPETLVATFYESLNRQQRSAVVFPFDDPRRTVLASDWCICEHRIDQTFDSRQQAMIREIFMGLHSPRYASAVMAQVDQDNEGQGLGDCTAAFFGDPGRGKPFEFVLTGRHVTRRCCAEGGLCTAGGPVFIGGAGRVYGRGLSQAQAYFETITGELSGWLGADGIATAQLWSDQKEKILGVLATVLAPLRTSDVGHVLRHIRASLSLPMELTVCRDMPDPADDSCYIEGPAMAWHFVGQPYLKTWVELRGGV